MPHPTRELIRAQDIMTKTAGFQPTRTGKRSRRDWARWPHTNAVALWVLDLEQPKLGWQLTLEGTTVSDIPRGIPIGRSFDGSGANVFRVARRRRRRINPGNTRAHFNAVDRILEGERWAKKLFRFGEKIRSGSVKKRPRAKRRRK